MSKRPRSIVHLKRTDVKWSSSAKIHMNNKKNGSKKQRKLFEFDIPTASQLAVKNRSKISITRENSTTIDLTPSYPILIEDDENDVKQLFVETDEEQEDDEEVIEIDDDSKNQDISIIEIDEQETEIIETDQTLATSPIRHHQSFPCPICNKDLSNLELYQREAHAETCLESLPVEKVHKLKQKKKKSQKPRLLKERPPLPSIKIISFPTSNHELVVDGFNYSSKPTISQYFLSHFHSDHTIGFVKSWNQGTIFCSPETSLLLQWRYDFAPEMIKELHIAQREWITDTISVISYDAFHCPGSLIFVFEEWDSQSMNTLNKRVLHTGDFRCNNQVLSNVMSLGHYDQVYLDTTYLDSWYRFPRQDSVVETTGQFAKDVMEIGLKKLFGDDQKSIFSFMKSQNKKRSRPQSSVLFLIGSYSLGKEKIGLEIQSHLPLGTYNKIFMNGNAVRGKLFAQDERFTSDREDMSQCNIHIVSLSVLQCKETVEDYLKSFPDQCGFDDVVGFVPTGWTFSNRYKGKQTFENMNDRVEFVRGIIEGGKREDDEMSIDWITKQYKKYERFQIFKIPYSEHSSFKELCSFGSQVDCDEILATVNLNNLEQLNEMRNWFKSWEIIRKSKFN